MLYEIVAQITPRGVESLYKPVLFFPPPGFDLFFPFESGINICCVFIINQFMDIVPFCKTVNQLILMFVQSANQVIRYTDI